MQQQHQPPVQGFLVWGSFGSRLQCKDDDDVERKWQESTTVRSHIDERICPYQGGGRSAGGGGAGHVVFRRKTRKDLSVGMRKARSSPGEGSIFFLWVSFHIIPHLV